MNRFIVACWGGIALVALRAGCAQPQTSTTSTAASAALDCSAVDPAHAHKRWICHCEGGRCDFLSVARQGCEHGHSGHSGDFDAPRGAPDCACAGSCTPNGALIYLNRNGGQYRGGAIDDSRTNTSGLIAGTQSVLPFEQGDAAWQTFVASVKGLYVPFDVRVTDVDPGSASHVEAVIGGQPQNIGAPAGILGLARTGCDVRPNAIVFAFSKVHNNDVTSLCYTAANVMAHTYGLQSEFLASDIMSDLASATKAFQDQAASCGSFAPQACECGGTTQNSYAKLLSALGPAPTCPCAAE